MRSFRLLWISLLLFPGIAQAEVRLVGDRVEIEEKTEVRFDVPDGCVITGIGFRAHQENVTTMHARYHRVTADGRLADPRTVRVGSEPDHDCEVEVHLPDGYVMVGFGARGAPEWDVTTLRVWARPLGEQAALGPVRVFNSGKDPEHGLERSVLPEDADRVITAVGLRMAGSDIAGIYARSRRLLSVDAQARQRLSRMRQRGWMIAGIAPEFLEQVLARTGEFGVSFLMASFDALEGGRTIPDATAERGPLAAMAKRCAERNVGFYLWVRDRDLEPRSENDPPGALLAEVMAGIAEIPGFIVGLRAHGLGVGSDEEAKALENLHALAGICERHSRTLVLRAAAGNREEVEQVARVVRSFGPVTVLVPAVVGEWDSYAPDNPLLGMFPGKRVLVELDLGERNAGRCLLPYARPGELQDRLVTAGLAGVDGVVARIGGSRIPTLGTQNEFNLWCLGRLIGNPLQPLEPLWTAYYARKYGESAPGVISAMRRTRSAVDLIYHVDRFQFLAEGSRMAGIPGAEERLAEGLDHWLPKLSPNREELQKPTLKTLERALQEKETALWLIEQSRSDLGELSGTLAPAESENLNAPFQLLEESARLWQQWVRVYFLTQIYMRDASPRTLDSLHAALKELPARHQAVQKLIAEPFSAGNVTDIMAEVNERIRTTQSASPLLLAFRRVKELEQEAKHAEAAQALASLMDDARFRAYVGEHNDRLAALSSSLQALGGPLAEIEVRRGADGTWNLEKQGGKWAWTTTPGNPVVYFDVRSGTSEPPRDFELTFEYFDQGEKELSVHYDSDFPDSELRQYHPTAAIPITGTGTWKSGRLELPRARFAGGQNLGADLRFIQSGEVMRIRSVKIAPK